MFMGIARMLYGKYSQRLNLVKVILNRVKKTNKA